MAELKFACQYYAWIWEGGCQKRSKLDNDVARGGLPLHLPFEGHQNMTLDIQTPLLPSQRNP